MIARNTGVIFSVNSHNRKGGYKCICLTSGSIVKCRSFTKIPMPEEVIQRVAVISASEHQPNTLTFMDRNGHTVKPDIMHHDADPT